MEIFFSQLSINKYATGKAIRQDIPASNTKLEVINGMICMMPAPIIFRLLISFCLCWVVKAINPNKPRQVITIVSMEKAAKFSPSFDRPHIEN